MGLEKSGKNEFTFTIRKYKKGDESRIIKHFNAMFNEKRLLKHWLWKFMENPFRSEVIVAVDKNNKIVGQHATCILEGIYNRKRYQFYNVSEISIDEKYRGRGFTKKCTDIIKKKGTMLYGFPEEPIKPTYKKYDIKNVVFKNINKYEKRIRFIDILKKLINIKNEINIKKASEKSEEEINMLWDEKKQELEVSAIRNWDYLKWRVMKNPNNIKLYTIKKHEKIIGYFALEKRKNICYIIDILVLDKYLNGNIFSEIERKACLMISYKIRIMSNDAEIIKILRRIGYRVFNQVQYDYLNLIDGKNNLNLYLTYADGADGDYNIK